MKHKYFKYIQELTERSNGHITGVSLATKIREYLNITLDHKLILKYRHADGKDIFIPVQLFNLVIFQLLFKVII